jgi:hypothetical protein
MVVDGGIIDINNIPTMSKEISSTPRSKASLEQGSSYAQDVAIIRRHLVVIRRI